MSEVIHFVVPKVCSKESKVKQKYEDDCKKRDDHVDESMECYWR